MKTGSAKQKSTIFHSFTLIPRFFRLDLHHHSTSHPVKMPISKKDRIHREHKKAEAAGTRIPVNPNGTPKKVPKATSICVFCKKELVSHKPVKSPIQQAFR